ncbi:MAG: hypothetical protein KF901_22660, partial [Myxococcales bacterium]|nr:hypothetical protein [Myxococcales bacterium]
MGSSGARPSASSSSGAGPSGSESSETATRPGGAPRFDWRSDFGPAELAAADAELFVLARGLGRVR